MIKTVHVITDLSVGGAQNMLYKLLSRTDRNEFEPVVVSLKELGPIGEKIVQLGIPVHSLGMDSGAPEPAILMRLARMLSEIKPNIVQTWMYHADLIGGLAAKMGPRTTIVWNIRHSQLDPATIKRSTLMIGKLCAKLSGIIPDKILCCSEVARDVHGDLGYKKDKIVVIPNGFNLTEYSPEPEARASVCAELAIPIDAPIIGLVGRYHAQKNHMGLIETAARLNRTRPDVHYVLCGDDVDWSNQQLTEAIDAVGMKSVFRLLGRRNDLPRLNSSFDFVTLCSLYGEGFPNVVGEAMACGTPCVVTDVGDSAAIVGDTGYSVAAGDSTLLLEAWERMLSIGLAGRKRLGALARERVQEHYEIANIVCQYEALYRGLVGA